MFQDLAEQNTNKTNAELKTRWCPTYRWQSTSICGNKACVQDP